MVSCYCWIERGLCEVPWLLKVYMDGVVRDVNLRVLGKGLDLLTTNGSRFEINRLLFAGDTY